MRKALMAETCPDPEEEQRKCHGCRGIAPVTGISPPDGLFNFRESREFRMADTSRLNNIIRAWEQGRPAFASFADASRQTAIEFSTAPCDGVVFEMEHNPWDVQGLQDSLQYLLNRQQILKSGSLAPAVTPLVRIPANGVEKNQSFAKQALDRGVYGVVWPHVSDADEAYNAVASCRYARPEGVDRYEPAGVRGDGPTAA